MSGNWSELEDQTEREAREGYHGDAAAALAVERRCRRGQKKTWLKT